ncbi:MAG TPA: hypothetical protein DD490_20565 [Acidobacteria bacterium]|nr:hypothetical protein [Acidobacteriota bacterium]
MKATTTTLSYTDPEIRSYLPSGWNLTADGPGAWDAKKGVWRTMIMDNVDFDYPVEVKPEEATALGRLAALRKAIDRVHRERLGKRIGPLNL